MTLHNDTSLCVLRAADFLREASRRFAEPPFANGGFHIRLGGALPFFVWGVLLRPKP